MGSEDDQVMYGPYVDVLRHMAGPKVIQLQLHSVSGNGELTGAAFVTVTGPSGQAI